MAEVAFLKPEIVIQNRHSNVGFRHRPQAATQSWQDKAFVFINGTGQLEECDQAGGANITQIMGLVDYAASGTTDEKTRYQQITNDGEEFIITLDDSGDPLLAVTSESLVGKKFGLYVNNTNTPGVDFWAVDQAETANPHVLITRVAPKHPLGSQHGALYAKLLTAVSQYEGA